MENISLQQHENFKIALEAAGKTAKMRICEGRNFFHIDRGPLRYLGGVTQIFPRVLCDDLRKRRIVIVNCDAATAPHMRGLGFRQVMTAATMARLKTHTYAPHPKWQASLRRAQQSCGLRTTHTALRARDAWIFKADHAQQRAKGFRAMPHHISQNWPRGDTLCCICWQAKIPIAAMVFLRHGTNATYQIGWTSDAGRDVCAHHLLLSQAIARLERQGVQSIDLGLLDTVNAPGLARFKLGAGAIATALGGTWIAAPRL